MRSQGVGSKTRVTTTKHTERSSDHYMSPKTMEVGDGDNEELTINLSPKPFGSKRPSTFVMPEVDNPSSAKRIVQ